MATLKDVARMSGVSTATVSYVINNGPRPVAEKTRERVLGVIAKLNYRPSAAARGLKGKRTDTLGIIFPMFIGSPLDNQYYEPILSGILEVATERKSSSLIYTGLYWDEANENIGVYTDGRCDGLILLGPPEDSSLIEAIVGDGVPMVVGGSNAKNRKFSTVDVDNVTGTRLATRYLLELGHRNICFLQGIPDAICSWERVEGFNLAHADFGLTVSPDQFISSGYRLLNVYEESYAVLSRPVGKRPTGIVAFDDGTALRVLQAAKALGISVPDELSVVGFNDCVFASQTEPPLTTIRQPLREIGRRAANLLLDRVHNADAPIANVIFDAELVVRQSTAPPP